MSTKLRPIHKRAPGGGEGVGERIGWLFFCPGCDQYHGIYDVPGFKNHEGKEIRWKWNGSEESPTFSPSLLLNKDDPKSRCHIIITDGVLQFCADCFHSLAKKHVPMIPVEEAPY